MATPAEAAEVLFIRMIESFPFEQVMLDDRDEVMAHIAKSCINWILDKENH